MTRRTAPVTPPPAKEKKAPETRPCGCGCGEQTPRRFRPGHDARVTLGATCQPADGDCQATASWATGKIPVCDAHLAGRLRETQGGRVRSLAAPAPAAQAQAS
jgi:hypothetical protein